MPKPELHQLHQSGATRGQAPLWDPDAMDGLGEWAAGDVVKGLTSADSSVTITDNGDGTLDLSASGGGGGSGGVGKDRRWNVGPSETTIDEFNDDILNAAWVRVDGTGAPAVNVAWTEAADVLSGVNNSGDSAAALHGLIQPLAGAGGPVAVGDAFLTCLTMLAAPVNYAFTGLILADGSAFGAGKQVAAVAGRSSTSTVNAEAWAMASWNSRTATAGSLQYNDIRVNYLRVACVAANTWRADASPDGISWIKGSANLALTFTPTHVGFCSTSYGTSTKHIASFEFLRRVSGVT